MNTVTPSYHRSERVVAINFTFAPEFPVMSALDKCNALGAIAAELRRIADEADEERLTIASEELSA